MAKGPLPLLLKKCKTCPFRDGSPTEFLREELGRSALTEASRICHSTGSNNAFHHRTGKPPMLCRGARDVQLAHFAGTGFIKEPTDEAWNERCAELGITPNSNRKKPCRKKSQDT